jgi:hypothetical protein
MGGGCWEGGDERAGGYLDSEVGGMERYIGEIMMIVLLQGRCWVIKMNLREYDRINGAFLEPLAYIESLEIVSLPIIAMAWKYYRIQKGITRGSLLSPPRTPSTRKQHS